MSVGNLAQVFAFAMTQTVKIKPSLGPTGNGGRLYGTERIYPCRVQEDAKPIFTATGQQVVSTTTIEVYPRATDGTVLMSIDANAVVTLADGTSPRILKAGSVHDLDGGIIYWRVLT